MKQAGTVFLLFVMQGFGILPLNASEPPAPGDSEFSLYDRENLVAWCIVPFDDRPRPPAERAAMLQRLGIRKFAYDYRPRHREEFETEITACRAAGIEIVAWWFPTTWNAEAKELLALFQKHNIQPMLWVTGGGSPVTTSDEQQARLEQELVRLRPIVEAAEQAGCRVGLYNHGGWFGEPENLVALVKALNQPHVGIVYNLHHGHEHLAGFRQRFDLMRPWLVTVNLNGMTAGGDRKGQKILPLGAGEYDRELLQVIRDSGYRGPIGILNHTQENAELRLRDQLAGLTWLLAEQAPGGDGKPPAEPPKYESFPGGSVPQRPLPE